VYKAHLIQLQGPPRVVAVKTLKGIVWWHDDALYTVLPTKATSKKEDDLQNMTLWISKIRSSEGSTLVVAAWGKASVDIMPPSLSPYFCKCIQLSWLEYSHPGHHAGQACSKLKMEWSSQILTFPHIARSKWTKQVIIYHVHMKLMQTFCSCQKHSKTWNTAFFIRNGLLA